MLEEVKPKPQTERMINDAKENIEKNLVLLLFCSMCACVYLYDYEHNYQSSSNH